MKNPQKHNFVHLHLHTEYSLLDGVLKILPLMEKVKSLGMEAVAITDHGNLFGLISFYQKAKSYGIKPILGCEFYLAPRTIKDKDHGIDSEHNHVTVLASNFDGYKNLIKLSSISFIEGFYGKPRIDKNLLEEYKEGLIILSGCKDGELSDLILKENIDKAKEVARWYQSTFGEENFFLEIQDNQIEGQRKINECLRDISQELSIPMVLTNDVHYLEKEDATIQDIMLCIQTASTLDSEGRLSFGSDQFYLKSYEEMLEIGKEFPSAVENTVMIGERCNVEIEFGKFCLPQYDIPSGEEADSFLRELSLKGVREKYPAINQFIQNRLEYELKTIKELGFSSYFLIIWDVMNHAKKIGVPVGTGRGSGAGSLIAYCLGITQIDPLKYGLVFERFLNPDRVNLPDFDLDFCNERRGEIIDFLIEKYGKDKVAQIVTFNKEMAKLAIRDVGRVLGIPLKEVDRIAKMIPFATPGGEGDSNIEKSIKSTIELENLYNENPQAKKLLDISMKVEGLTRNVSTHAAGVVITDTYITEKVPVFKRGGDGIVMTQYADDELEMLGLLKTDILGLKNLSVISRTLENIKKLRKIDVDLEKIPLNDKKTYSLFSEGKTDGVFQFEGAGMKNLLRRAKPTNIEDLIALNALHRPGPIGTGMVEDFIKRKKGEVKIKYIHQSLEPVLKETYGTIVYQEQVMRIANVIAGFSLAQADILRRAMAKKEKEKMAKQRKAFQEGAKQQGIDTKLASEIFDLINHFAGYGFNKSHSAAYGLMAYRIAYLKVNYTVEFMAALLSTFFDKQERVSKYIEECKSLSIPVYPPDINKSQYDFSISGKGIRFGLSAIKNVGEGAIEEILKARDRIGEFKTIFDVTKNVNPQSVNAKVIESLIRSGACDSLEGNKAQKLAVILIAIEIGKKFQSDREMGQTSLFSSPTSFNSQDTFPSLQNIEELSDDEIMRDEKDLLGIYITHHPLDPFKSWLLSNDVVSISDLEEYMQIGSVKDGDIVRVGGVITNTREHPTKNGQKMKFIQIEDMTGRIEAVAFSSILKRYDRFLTNSSIIIIIGKISSVERESLNDETKIELRMRCDDIIPHSREPIVEKKKREKLNIKILPKENIEEILLNIRDVLTNNLGECDVILHLPSEDKEIILEEPKVACDISLLNQLQNIAGNDNVWIEEL